MKSKNVAIDSFSLNMGKHVICRFLIYLVKSYSIVEVDIYAGNGDHSFVLVCIDELVYIVDSYAKIRKPEIRMFDCENFDNYVKNGSIDSYNEVFSTKFEYSEEIGILEGVHISVCEGDIYC
jgi:hypothetical protein